MLTGSTDHTARLWDTDYQDSLRRACSHLTRDLIRGIPLILAKAGYAVMRSTA